MTITNAPLRALIVLAYGVLPQQLTGGPDWLDSTRYDIVAQANQNLPMSQPGGPPAPAHLLLQRLLADRFALRVHSDKRELQIYALTVARDDGRLGPAISRSTLDCAARMDAYGRGAGPMPAQSECSMTAAPGRMSARGVVMPMFARGLLSVAVDAIVEDRTGLSGGFDFDLEFSVASATAPVTGGGAEDVSLFTALVEQLGLRLRPLRAPVDVLVIDRVERPAED